jgi:hypothetical protein
MELPLTHLKTLGYKQVPADTGFAMETYQENTYPRLCFEVGLTCESCTTAAARQLAQCCKGLRGKMIGQLFVQLYPNPACAGMHGHFADAYREASSERPKILAAVA